ncbi:MAG: M23 family metallopeptidase [Paludibacter sp.]|nr:M23 family metallopeptidase [Bacteroidales bacterium]MCM1068980.1 M23 family metallopeptidase [Prevotella sp.]MCM1353643.1 M23 family metallopeptidase [Bacteroides sp.]MCM1442008.1 M23 family metallopeptidase [Muribaculum sp.]MCM1481536.1 M23 family metallopeptidase [Paludibacter sp.]
MEKKGYWQRIRFKYRVSILNENTLNETWHMRLSRMGIFFGVLLLLVFNFAVFAAVVWLTPIKNYLPGYNEDIRQQLVQEMARVDSLNEQWSLQNNYLTVLKAVVAGELEADSIEPSDSLFLLNKEQLLEESSPILSTFVEQYETKEKGNLTVFDMPLPVLTSTLFRPAHGVIEKHFNPDEAFYGVSVRTPRNENVTSVLAGTVLYAAHSIDDDWVIMVQHESDYVSIYKNVQRLLKTVGDMVQAGESIAIASEEQLLVLEIWQHGVAVNPEEIIAF